LFENSGYVLQDTINEMGRRIGYEVVDGLYSGNKNDIGFDGLWKYGSDWIVVEVKTTDAYRINLDKVMAYARRLEKTTDEDVALSALIVAGRQDTGDLEAQIRGSKHAWSVRLISVDALVKLLFLNSELDDENYNYKVNKILRPFEYTRVDEIVDLIFETQQETEKTLTGEDKDEADGVDSSKTFDVTPKNELNAKRLSVAASVFRKIGAEFVQKSKTNFESVDGKIGICCAVSKRYQKDYQPYWYALHPKWVEFMKMHDQGYFVLSCMDRKEAYCLPFELVSKHMDKLNTTQKTDGQYWHIALNLDDDKLKWNLSKAGIKIDLAPYAVAVE
jgi:hypothetical protein